MLSGLVLDTGNTVVNKGSRKTPFPACIELKFKWVTIMYMFLRFISNLKKKIILGVPIVAQWVKDPTLSL